ncbi:MAG: DEAD/DEAH box helicase family protein [Armatimonadetes bacterium]|nr:DEAD/DEAH box helicase family protein [Armatimonadota bacterium]
MTFFPEEDAAVLNLAESGAASPAADLYLHRQALGLLLSPGFETLLSVQAARDIQLLDYQLATVRHVLKHLRGRALLCDEVGLGKTIEAGLIMMEYLLRGLVRRVLVLTPPSLVEQWRLEMQTKFNLDFITYDAPLFKSTPRPWAAFPYIIASLDTAKREPHRSMVLEPAYDLVIVDEAHHLKKQTTQAYQLVSRLKKKYVLFLTATPVENDLEELFNLITLLQPGQLETASSFKRKYITRGDPLKPKNTEELKKLVREVMVRNRRSETGAITARRHAEVVEVDLTPEEAAFYRRLTSFVRGHYTPEAAKLSGGVNQFVLKTLQREVGSSIEAVLPTLQKMAANEENPPSLRRLLKTLAGQAGEVPRRAKAEALVRLLKKIPAKVVVFTCFRETLHFLAALLEREGLSVARLHGGMRRAEKEAQVQAFAGGARVLVSTETGSEGRNLQFCNVLVNYDLPWNPMRIEQRIGRLHRLGQTKDVYIYNLSAAGTVEAYLLELLDAKINMFQLVVGELDMILGNLREKKDFEDIVMDIWAGAADEATLQAGLAELGEKLAAAKEHYLAVKELDDRLLGELLPEKD